MVSTGRSHSASTLLSIAPFVVGIVCLIVGHVAIVFVLYGSGAFVRFFSVPLELVVFLFPAVVAFTGYYFLLRARAIRMVPPWVAAFLLTLLSFSLSLLPRLIYTELSANPHIAWNANHLTGPCGERLPAARSCFPMIKNPLRLTLALGSRR